MVEMARREDQNVKDSQNGEKDMLGEVLGREWTKEPVGCCLDGQKPMGIKGENEGPERDLGKANT